MTVIRHSDAPRNEGKASAILAAFRAEYPSCCTGSGNKQHGCEIRYRNKLVRKAGYEYGEAYHAVHAIAKEVVTTIRAGQS